MLNPFPIQFLALLAYFLLRLFVGSILVYFGIKHARSYTSFTRSLSLPFFPYPAFLAILCIAIEIVCGVMFILGLYTQIAALITIVLCIKMLVFKKYFTSPAFASRSFYVLLLGCCLSLFITGAGAIAFDLPI